MDSTRQTFAVFIIHFIVVQKIKLLQIEYKFENFLFTGKRVFNFCYVSYEVIVNHRQYTDKYVHLGSMQGPKQFFSADLRTLPFSCTVPCTSTLYLSPSTVYTVKKFN